jgi:hypothetical protein
MMARSSSFDGSKLRDDSYFVGYMMAADGG